MVEWPFNDDIDFLSAFKENKPLLQSRIDSKSSEIKELSRWFTTTPSFTTIRVNTVNTNVQHVIDIIKTQLYEQSVDHGFDNIPSVIQDSTLKDCLVVSPWSLTNELLKCNEKICKEVIVDIQCGISILRGANVFAPGVMAITPSAKEGDLVNVFADISKNCLKGSIKFYNDPSKKFLGYGIVKMSRKSLFESNSPITNGVAIVMKRTITNVPSFSCPSEFGLLQNYPSILCSHVLNPQKKDLILDMCASPGNKTTHIASLLNGQGHIIALDKTQKKVDRIKENTIKQRLSNITTFLCNSIKAVNNDINIEQDVLKGPPFNQNTFDRILLDAPCSALGQRPQLRHQVTLNHLNSYSALQKKLFTTAVKLLKPGGYLVYSTCTLLIIENEGIVSWALNEFPELCLSPAEPIVGSSGTLNCGLTEEQCHLVQKFGPFQSPNNALPYLSDTVGFFIAKFKKVVDK